MRVLRWLATALLLLSLPTTARTGPTPNHETVSTRGEIEDDDDGLDADTARWKNGQPSPPLPPSFAGTDCPEHCVIYVHGFQNTPADAEENFTQAAAALGGAGGPVIGFSWDSDTGVNDFDSAREAANLNGKVLADLIKRMKMKCPDVKINLISHSLGARVILQALKCGGCAVSVQLIASAVDEDVFGEGEEFGADEIAVNGGRNIKVWFNDDDDVLGTYPWEEGDAALGEDGPEDSDCVRPGVSSCDAEPKLKAGAKKGGESQNPHAPGTDAEDDHSGYLYGGEFMKCVKMRLK